MTSRPASHRGPSREARDRARRPAGDARRVIDDGVVEVADGLIGYVGPTAAGPATPPTPVGTIAPGFVDIHCHGGGGTLRPPRTRPTSTAPPSITSAAAPRAAGQPGHRPGRRAHLLQSRRSPASPERPRRRQSPRGTVPGTATAAPTTRRTSPLPTRHRAGWLAAADAPCGWSPSLRSCPTPTPSSAADAEPVRWSASGHTGADQRPSTPRWPLDRSRWSPTCSTAWRRCTTATPVPSGRASRRSPAGPRSSSSSRTAYTWRRRRCPGLQPRPRRPDRAGQ